MIKKIRVKNFKSFKDLELSLGKVNILIGANASGKSNFVQIFRFLRDIVTFGLESAISNQGGIEYIRNVNFRHDSIFLEITYSYQQSESNRDELSVPDLKRYEIVYTLSIEPKEGNSGFRVTEDRVLCKYKNQDNEIKELVISNVNGKIVLSTDQIAESEMDLKDIYRDFFTDILKNSRLEFPESLAATVSEQIRIRDRSTLLENYNLLVLFGDLSCYGDLTIYDFNPKLSKQAILMAGNAILAEEGWNLPIVLKNILDNDNEKREFINLVIYFLGFVKDLRIQKTADNRFFLELLETYSEEYLSAYLVSDGTINIANLIIALFFDAKPLTIIEEPEKNIHPHLISKVVSSMKDASEHKQIIATTHNPEMIRHADLNDVLLVFRDEDGFSSIIKPSSKRNVEDFLKNGMRLEDLYVDNLLEI